LWEEYENNFRCKFILLVRLFEITLTTIDFHMVYKTSQAKQLIINQQFTLNQRYSK
jgi:hypothetical protein